MLELATGCVEVRYCAVLLMNPGAMPRYDFQFTSLSELAEAHQTELRV